MPDSLTLENRVAIVTGGGRGIGRAIALEFARRGASVLVNDKSGESVVCAEINDAGGKASCLKADISDFAEAQSLIKFAIDTFGDLHILVNNAGITRDGLILTMSEDDWDKVMAVNLKGTFNCSKAAVKHMIRKRYGRIINISSVAGQMGNAGQTNYASSKAGVIGFTKSLAREVASRSVTVNAIAPGFVDTEILKAMSPEILEAAVKLVPLGRKGKPEEIGYAAAFLASEEAAYITGQVLGVDGGMAMM
ncbi:MAG TPA: 3-oxoacyl-[acyl-carrier-protein] reductase [Anaerolineales bacterium]|nr:3-oxoacyl-[acyl-carrier-protein] reductase [Anaerolineales bacterium]